MLALGLHAHTRNMVTEGEAIEEQQPARRGQSWVWKITQFVLMQMAIRYFMGGRGNRPARDPATGEIVPPLVNAFAPGTVFDAYVYLTPRADDDVSHLMLADDVQLLWTIPNERYVYDRWRKPSHFRASVPIPAEFREPGAAPQLYLATALVAHEHYLDRNAMHLEESIVDPAQAHLVPMETMPLVATMPPFTDEELQSLLDSSSDAPERNDPKQDAPETPHWKNHADVVLVYETTHVTPQTLSAPPMRRYLKPLPAQGLYLPIVAPTDWWLLERQYEELNATTLAKHAFDLDLSWNVVAPWSFALQWQLNEVWNPGPQTKQSLLVSLQGHSRRESFMLKRIVLDTNPVFLAFSTLFMLTHSLFSFLAFKNDFEFWKSRDSMEGLSAMSVFISWICEIIIGLYLFDSQGTSRLILFEVAMGIVFSSYKLTKAVKFARKPSFPFVSIAGARDYVESDTKKHDETAIRFMSLVLLPCFFGYAIYSLRYNRFRSWYSYIISTLAGGVYTFGFVLMTPQLYINYKLKSVDHLPWRALVYRALNTFVDDVAAFIIDMPWLHRLACFRDDVIFVLYLYQRWIYHVDKTRGPHADVTPPSDVPKVTG
eukprot:Polyplicarium_translucidae@DN3177_c0_g1_i1.p1